MLLSFDIFILPAMDYFAATCIGLRCSIVLLRLIAVGLVSVAHSYYQIRLTSQLLGARAHAAPPKSTPMPHSNYLLP